ncbi:MAG: hypothetical protein IJ386_00870 [Clostridia bacterium]|nr:hypothetical protein [Clostridia bacterium]
MPRTNGSITKKDLLLFYVIDVSGSMDGTKITVVNRSMEDNVKLLREIADEHPELNVKIAVLTFANRAEWRTSTGPVSVKKFFWKSITETGGGTVFSGFIEELDQRLHRTDFLKSEFGCYDPVIIFISDGAPTDADWQKLLSEKCENNAHLKNAKKIAIAIDDGDEVNSGSMREALRELVGSDSAVIEATSHEELKKKIIAVSASSLAITVQTHLLYNTGNADDIIKNAGNIPDEYFEKIMERKAKPRTADQRQPNVGDWVGDWNDKEWENA